MNIPKQFKLLGQTITVEFDEALNHNDDVHGWAKYRQNKIVLQPSTPQSPITQNAVEHNFIHELVHFVLYMSAESRFEPPLHQDECLVDRVAGLLHQMITTTEGTLNNKINTPTISQPTVVDEKTELAVWLNKLDTKLAEGFILSVGTRDPDTHAYDYQLIKTNDEGKVITGKVLGTLKDIVL